MSSKVRRGHKNYRQTFTVFDTASPKSLEELRTQSDEDEGAITLMFPLDTTVKIKGNAFVIKQLMLRLDGVKIIWREENVGR